MRVHYSVINGRKEKKIFVLEFAAQPMLICDSNVQKTMKTARLGKEFIAELRFH